MISLTFPHKTLVYTKALLILIVQRP